MLCLQKGRALVLLTIPITGTSKAHGHGLPGFHCLPITRVVLAHNYISSLQAK